MTFRPTWVSRLTIGIGTAVSLLFPWGLGTAQISAPLTRSDFTLSAPQGFGSRHNSWAWSMLWWKGKLYVGTNRDYSCVGAWSLRHTLGSFIAYPPNDVDLSCAANPADLSLRAEIWRWTPESNLWQRVYQAPQDLINPDSPNKMLSRDMGYRTMVLHTEPGGVEALYVGGVSTQPMWSGKIPRPRILRSTDGITFVPLPQTPGTVLGDIPDASFRSLTSFGGKLFVLHGTVQGKGILYASDNPAAGNNAWQVVGPIDVQFFELEVFDGWLYAGVYDPINGYALIKTQATGSVPYQFATVISNGAHLSPNPSGSVMSLHPFNRRLYVGTASIFFPQRPVELLRVNPDDSWDLVMGTPRQTRAGWKYPLSGLPEGFGNGFTDHVWRIGSHDGRLYAGTYESEIEWRALPGLDDATRHLNGFDLYEMADSWYVTPVTFAGIDDPFSLGVRTFASTPYGLFVGSANPYYGLRVWRGFKSTLPAVAPPQRLMMEMSAGAPLLSWAPSPGATRYRILRAPVTTLTAYPSILGNPSVPGLFTSIAVTTQPAFKDAVLTTDSRYLYIVVAENAQGVTSAASNMVYAPLLIPTTQFSSLVAIVDALNGKSLFLSPAAAAEARQTILTAQTQASAGNYSGAWTALSGLRNRVLAGTVALPPFAADLEILIDKEMRRIGLAQAGVVPPASL